MLNILAEVTQFCTRTSPIWQFVGYVLYVFKIAIPLLLIIFGMMDLGKAVVANDDKAIKNATSSLVKRAIAGVVIFFLPFLVSFIFGIVIGFDDVEKDYKICQACITNPNKKDGACKTAVESAKDATYNEKTDENNNGN
ncbi:MAG: hypothetical protein IJA94_03740 [Bacilli bacterium]|nr:hypothetical protein [Bacilli bacterium]